MALSEKPPEFIYLMLGTREECVLPGGYPVRQASGLGGALYQWKPGPLTQSIWIQKLHNSAGTSRYGASLSGI